MKTTRIVAFASCSPALPARVPGPGTRIPSGSTSNAKIPSPSGAGDAKAVNAATHVIDPWPRYVGNRNIPVSGDRLSRAVNRYSQGSCDPPALALFPLIGFEIRGGGRGGHSSGCP